MINNAPKTIYVNLRGAEIGLNTRRKLAQGVLWWCLGWRRGEGGGLRAIIELDGSVRACIMQRADPCWATVLILAHLRLYCHRQLSDQPDWLKWICFCFPKKNSICQKDNGIFHWTVLLNVIWMLYIHFRYYNLCLCEDYIIC